MIAIVYAALSPAAADEIGWRLAQARPAAPEPPALVVNGPVMVATATASLPSPRAA